MSELPIDAQDLTPNQHIVVPSHAAPGDQICRVLYTHLSRHFVSATLLRLADDEVIQARFHLTDSVRLATPAQVEEAEADGQRARITEGLEQLVRHIRLERLPLPEIVRIYAGLSQQLGITAEVVGLGYSRTDPEAEPTASCPAGVACTGRDGQPSPHACPECRHCSIHGEAGCAARKSGDVRCGCTGGGA